MAIPKFHEVTNPVLEFISDGRVYQRRDVRVAVVDALNLTPDERGETMSGGGKRAESRVGWAMESLYKSGAIERPSRGQLQITDFGSDLLRDYPGGIPFQVLLATEGMQEWKRISIEKARARHKGAAESDFDLSASTDTTPEEQMEIGFSSLRSAVSSDLLERLRTEAPLFLENVVLKLLHAMGYGEGDEDTLHLGGSGDGGVDGVINQDKLGLDQIYVQVKRYARDNTVGPGAIRDFNTAVQTKKASRGVFITTSRFTADAVEVLRDLPYTRIVLIDGNQLTDLMLEHGVGVTVDKVYKVYKIDENFFEE
ncbi:MAG: restriction endonuclease [Hyphomicrobiales bacterium]